MTTESVGGTQRKLLALNARGVRPGVDVAPELNESADYIAQLSEETQLELRKHIDVHFGPQLLELINDGKTTDIYRNGNGSIYVATVSEPPRQVKIQQSDADARLLIANIASAYGTPINPTRPHVERPLPWYDARFTGTLPPWSDGPMWACRMHRSRDVTLDDYIESHRATEARIEAIRSLIRSDKNIFFFGSQGDGKTRALDATLAETAKMNPDTRFAVLQDTPEIRVKHPNVYYLYASAEAPIATMAHLIKMNLRYGAFSLSIGEVREQAFSLLEAWTTGTTRSGGATSHGKSIDEGLRRLEILLARDGVPVNRETRFAIKQAVGGFVQLSRQNGVRGYISRVVRITDVTDTWYRFVDIDKEGV